MVGFASMRKRDMSLFKSYIIMIHVKRVVDRHTMPKYMDGLLYDNLSITVFFSIKEERESNHLRTTATFFIDYLQPPQMVPMT